MKRGVLLVFFMILLSSVVIAPAGQPEVKISIAYTTCSGLDPNSYNPPLVTNIDPSRCIKLDVDQTIYENRCHYSYDSGKSCNWDIAPGAYRYTPFIFIDKLLVGCRDPSSGATYESFVGGCTLCKDDYVMCVDSTGSYTDAGYNDYFCEETSGYCKIYGKPIKVSNIQPLGDVSPSVGIIYYSRECKEKAVNFGGSPEDYCGQESCSCQEGDYVTLNLNTDLSSECRFSNSDMDFNSMDIANQFSSSDKLSHTFKYSELNGLIIGSNTLYVKCRSIDDFNIVNIYPDIISFNLVSACSNGIKDSDETGVDCGGVCVGEGKLCTNGNFCNANSDCQSNKCLGNTCTDQDCIDTETGQDQYVFGTVSFANQDGTYQSSDQCKSTNPNILWERYCTTPAQGNLGTTEINCPYGCTNGICNAPICTINKIGWGVYRAGDLIGEAYYNVVDGESVTGQANLIDPNNIESDDDEDDAIEVLFTDELEAILETSGCSDTQKSAFAPEIYESDFSFDTKRETLTDLSTSASNTNQLRKRWTGLQNVPDLEREEQFYLRVNPESPPIETEDPSIICGNNVIDTNYGEECDDSATPVYSGDNDGTCKKFNSLYKFGNLACGEPGTSDACLINEDEQLETLFADNPTCLASVQAGNKATFTVGECIDGSKTVNCQVPSRCEGIQEALDVFCRGEETKQVICLTQLEEPFPVFTWFNIVIVTLILCGYYLIRRKKLIK